MCYLVSWRMVPKSQAGIATLNAESFVDEDERDGCVAAMEFAERCLRDGASDVRVWTLYGQAKLETVIRWEKVEQ